MVTQFGQSDIPREVSGRRADRGTPAWPYRVTTKYSFYPVKETIKTTIVALWNNKSNDLTKNCLPLCACRISRATGSIRCPRAEGPNIYWVPQGVPTPQVPLIIYVELSNRDMQQIALKSNKLSIDWKPVIAVNSSCQGVDRWFALVRVYSVEQ